MPVDYTEVMQDLERQRQEIEVELLTIKQGIAAIQAVQKRLGPKVPIFSARFSSMGQTEAIKVLLADQPLTLTTGEVAQKLQDGGLRSKAADFAGTVSAVLTTLKGAGIVEKIGDGWRLTPRPLAALEELDAPQERSSHSIENQQLASQ